VPVAVAGQQTVADEHASVLQRLGLSGVPTLGNEDLADQVGGVEQVDMLLGHLGVGNAGISARGLREEVDERLPPPSGERAHEHGAAWPGGGGRRRDPS
jgi:hypothetical protein